MSVERTLLEERIASTLFPAKFEDGYFLKLGSPVLQVNFESKRAKVKSTYVDSPLVNNQIAHSKK